MTLKTLWAHRRQNGFVLAEIILITVLSFYFIDHFVVTTYDTYFCRPAGDFEREHLLVGQTGMVVGIRDSINSSESTHYDERVNCANLYALRDQIRALPEVQYAGFTSHIIGQGTYHTSSYASEADSTRRCGAYMQGFLLHEQFFETQGLTPIEGSPSAKELSEDYPLYGVVITRSLAQALFGTDQVVGRRIVEWDFSDRALQEQGEPVIVGHYTIAGVVEDFRLQQNDRYAYSILCPIIEEYATPKMLIRLKPEVNAEAFINQLTSPSSQALRQAGDRFLVSLQTYKDWEKKMNGVNDYKLTNTLLGILLALFLLNVILGTLGTYWLQLRKRTEDIGIMRSFGAKRRDIFLMIWKEAALLTLFASLLGQLIWFQFAINIDLSDGLSMTYANTTEKDWVNTFWLHYLIICLIQYLVLLAVVTLGVLVPAWRVCRKRPVEALQHL